MLIKDEGYYFGIGAFETIALEEGVPQFLDQHYKRLLDTLKFLGIQRDLNEIREQVNQVLEDETIKKGRRVLKITVSEKNIDIGIRDNRYCKEDYEKGFLTEFSKIRRNEKIGRAHV